MNVNELILYVADQERAATFYGAVLNMDPTLNVPGMTEFELGGTTLGLMPADDISQLIPGIWTGYGSRCELYLRRHDARAILDRAFAAGGSILSPIGVRPWGETVGYAVDPDGHIIAVAEA